MHRLLATVIFAYAGLSAAQWGEATRWLHGPPGRFWCGNVISDPYMLLVNVLAPLAAAANVALVRRALKTRRWPSYTITATLALVATLGCLAYEGYVLRCRYGVPLGDVWWLPWV
ncbi:MAG: hypothetical protein P4L84_24595 [Isosphaeraceae bacterium]|nr:hypothetical protein [Isosphaeraceae bacterium]